MDVHYHVYIVIHVFIIYMSSWSLCGEVCIECCVNIPEVHLEAAHKIWEYLQVKDNLEESDIILTLCSYDIRVAMEAARLWLDSYADILMFSGQSGSLTKGRWNRSEAEVFADVAISLGVPSNKILLETKSRNTGENLKNSYEILRSKNILPEKLILVQKPYMGKRTLATFLKQWPGRLDHVKFMVTSPDMTFLDYPNKVVGDLSSVILCSPSYFIRT